MIAAMPVSYIFEQGSSKVVFLLYAVSASVLVVCQVLRKKELIHLIEHE